MKSMKAVWRNLIICRNIKKKCKKICGKCFELIINLFFGLNLYVYEIFVRDINWAKNVIVYKKLLGQFIDRVKKGK